MSQDPIGPNETVVSLDPNETVVSFDLVGPNQTASWIILAN